MNYYPVNLDIRGRRCLVVGGGGVGTRKVKGLLECEAAVILVSPEAAPMLSDLARQHRIEWKCRNYDSSDIAGMFLVIAASDNEALNHRIHSDARQANILCSIADQPENCDFTLPSVIRRGDLQITISTSGKSPAFSKYLRKKLEKQFGSEYGEFLTLMGNIRKKLLAETHAPETHKAIFESLIEKGLLNMIKSRDTETINRLLAEVLGKAYSLESLMKAD